MVQMKLLQNIILLSALCKYCVSAKSAITTFNNGGIIGTVRYTQASAEDPVQIIVSLDGLDSRAGGYHVHELPVNFGGSGFQFNSFDSGCGGAITAGHFNPLNVQGGANNVEAGEYLCAPDRQEACEAGDISGKFGSLAGLPNFTGSFEDGDSGLTLFGKDSIIGRSMVIHRAEDGSRLVCANIFEENDQESEVLLPFSTAIATFDREDSGLEGTVTILTYPDSGTQTVFVNLALANDFPEDSATLDWSINSLPVLDIATDNKFDRCGSSSIGSISLDLSSQVEQLQLVKGQRTKILRTLTSEVLSITGKSLLVTVDGSIVDCSEFGKTAIAQFVAEDQSGLSGNFIFRQTTEDDPVTVSLELSGLDSRTNGYHVHTLPVFEDCASTTGHFNPLEVAGGDGQEGDYLCDRFNPEKCESGDLSNRFGGLLGRNTAAFSFSDTGAGLELFGRDSVVGRSVVIHRLDGSRLGCANIREFGNLIGAESVFSADVNSVEGTISMVQRAVDPDAETTVVFNLARVDGGSTSSHMFHIHEAPVSETNQCQETGAHFSPSGVNGGAGQSESDYRCEEGAKFCEIGDLSGKQSLVDLPNRFVFTDFTVPLSGIFSVQGLSITVHDEDGAGTRIDCANLVSFALETPDINSDGGDQDDDTDGVPGNGDDQDDNTDDAAGEDSDDDNDSVALIVFLVIFATISAVLSVYVFMLKMNEHHMAEELSRKQEDEKEEQKADQNHTL